MSERVTAEEITEMEQACEKATPGPWRWYFSGDVEGGCPETCDTDRRELARVSDEWKECPYFCFGWPKNEEMLRGTRGTPQHEHLVTDRVLYDEYATIDPNDAEFIANARQWLPRLISEVRQCQRERGEAQKENERLGEAWSQANDNAMHQVKTLFDAELHYSKLGNVELARANDDKARFLIQYFPAIFKAAFAYRESLGADQALRAALKDREVAG